MFPPFVHTLARELPPDQWPVAGQGWNQCSFASTANGLNMLVGEPRYHKDLFVREALLFYQPGLGGTIPPIKVPLIRRRGFGTHFGNLSHTDYRAVLRGLVDTSVPTIIEIGMGVPWVGPRIAWGRHAVLLVGYSEPFVDKIGRRREEWYLVDAEWPGLGRFDMRVNDDDYDGDGVVEIFPGNRSLSSAEFDALFVTRSYYPLFLSQADHNTWYTATFRTPLPGHNPLRRWITGSPDILR